MHRDLCDCDIGESLEVVVLPVWLCAMLPKYKTLHEQSKLLQKVPLQKRLKNTCCEVPV